MKAVVQEAYGSPEVLRLTEIDVPAVGDGHVLVRVRAAGVNAGDSFSMRGVPVLARLAVGFPRPRGYVPGWDVAGHVEAVGANVRRLRQGDEVFGACTRAFAEYVSAAEDRLAPMPSGLSFEQAAAVPTAALTALQGLRDKGRLQPGQQVLINGAAGGVGTFAVQIAKALGAEVTGVCSTRNVEMVRAIGADHVVDYTREDFTRSGRRYDLILDNVGSRSFSDCRRSLTPGGVVIPNTGHAGMGYVIKAYALSVFMRRQGRPFLASPRSQDLVFLTELIEGGKVTPVIDRTYPLSQTPEAIGYVGEGHARGKVVISV